MSNLCIIPARGGSKRIPRKNIKDFLGRPIISYSIGAALEAGIFDEVMVSTDDDEIAEIAVKFGAKVPFMRSVKNSNDFATTFDVVDEVLTYYEEQKINFKNSCCIYPCAPLLSTEVLKKSYVLLEKFDTVFPIVEYGYPVQRAIKMNNDKRIAFFYEDMANVRSQDLLKLYHDSGQFYWFSNKAVQEEGKLITHNSTGIILSELEIQDIDNEKDWKLAELKYKLLKGEKS